MKRMLITVALAGFISISGVARGQIRDAEAFIQRYEDVVMLVSFDGRSRMAVMRAANGITVTLAVPPDPQNLDAIEPGDMFTLRYSTLQAFRLSRDRVIGLSQEQTVELAPEGATPGVEFVRTLRMGLAVQEVDRANHVMAVRDLANNVFAVTVPEDMAGLDVVAPGDTITIVLREVVRLELISPRRPE